MIRKASLADLIQVTELHDKYVLDVSRVNEPRYAAKVQAEGFTVNAGGSDLAGRIQSSQLFNVHTDDQKISGYIDVNREIYFSEDADNILWFNNDLRSCYYHDKHATELHYIAVQPSGSGIAADLLGGAVKTLRDEGYQHLFSIVTTAPLTNCASIIWHTRNGFERACVSLPDDLFGLKNYQSTLFHRAI
jgi:hypothetical protein